MTSKFGAALSKLKKVDNEPEILKTGKEEDQIPNGSENLKTRTEENLNTGSVPNQETLKTRKEEAAGQNQGDQKTGKAEKKISGIQEARKEKDESSADDGNQSGSRTGKAEKKISGIQEKQKAGIPEILSPELKPLETPREKYSTILDRDLVTRMKMYAVRNRLKDREVVEAALRAYLPEE